MDGSVCAFGLTSPHTYLGDQLTHMTVDGHTLYFTYDASGTPLTLTYDGLKFYYITNLQGDVISIVNGNGVEFVHYTYDAWGNVTTDGSATNVRFYNPLRYRGYVYDPETGLYYLQSRYYDPGMGRFINADGYTATGQGLLGNNMFIYCSNNPVMLYDPTGEFAIGFGLFCVWAFITVGSLVVAKCVANMITIAIQWVIDKIAELDYPFQQTTQPVSETYFPTPEVPAQLEITIQEPIYDPSAVLDAKTKGKQNIRDTGLRDVPDEEIYKRARDKTLPPSEQKRYQKEEKGRGLRNVTKRKMHYTMPVGGFHLGMFRRSI